MMMAMMEICLASSKRVPFRFWNCEKNQREYLLNLAERLHIHRQEQWYRVRKCEMKKIRGVNGFLHNYGDSLQRALRHLLPNYSWKPWLFHQVPSGYWDDVRHRSEFLQWLSARLHISEEEQWYRVTVRQVRKNHGTGFLMKYGGSLQRALIDLLPQYPWWPWRFDGVAVGFWNDVENVRSYLIWLCEELKLSKMSDWDHVSHQQVQALEGDSLLKKFGGLSSILDHHFPNRSRSYLPNRFSTSINQRFSRENNEFVKTDSYKEVLGGIQHPLRKTHLRLLRTIQNLFPLAEERVNYRHHLLSYLQSGNPMELDIFLPQLSLGIEYQGVHHFHWNSRYGDSSAQKCKDEERRWRAVQHGLTLLEVPYWWDHSQETIVSMIRDHRPDLLLDFKIKALSSHCADSGNAIQVKSFPSPEGGTLLYSVAVVALAWNCGSLQSQHI